MNCPSIPLSFQWLCVTDAMLSQFCASHNTLLIFFCGLFEHLDPNSHPSAQSCAFCTICVLEILIYAMMLILGRHNLLLRLQMVFADQTEHSFHSNL